MHKAIAAGTLLILLLSGSASGCENQSSPKTLPDGVTPISKNMLGFWNSPGGPGCKWSIRIKSSSGKWTTVSSGGGNKSQSLIINHSMVNVGQLRSDKCKGWSQ